MKAFVCMEDGCYVVEGAGALRTRDGVVEVLRPQAAGAEGEVIAAVSGETLVVLGEAAPNLLELGHSDEDEEEEEEDDGG